MPKRKHKHSDEVIKIETVESCQSQSPKRSKSTRSPKTKARTKKKQSKPAAASNKKTTSPDTSNDEKVPRRPKLFNLLYEAYHYQTTGNSTISHRLYIEAIHRIHHHKTFTDENGKKCLEAQYRLDGTRLPLHLAIEQAAPYSVVRALVKAYPEAVQVKLDTMPLHMACAHPRKKLWEVTGQTKLGLEDDPDSEQVIRLLIETFPEAIGVKGGSESCGTALHLLLENKPSLQLVETMVKADAKVETDSSDDAKPILRLKDMDASLPLHVAVEYRASDEVVQYIYQGHPVATRFKRAIHDGFLVLHCAVYGGQSEECLTTIMESFPDALTHENNNGQTPLHMLFWPGNERRWYFKKDSRDSLGRKQLTGKEVCELLLKIYMKYQANKGVIVRKLLRKRDCWGKTILDSAKELKKRHPIPDDLIRFLEEGETGKFSTLPGTQSKKTKKIGLEQVKEDVDETEGEKKLEKKKMRRKEIDRRAHKIKVCELSSEDEEFEFE